MNTLRAKNTNDTRFLSLNVNGLGQEIKRRDIFRYLRTFKADIILLQETYSSKQSESIWYNELGSKIYFSHGETNSKGVAIMLGPTFNGEVEGHWIDQQGCFLALQCKIEEKSILIVNLYGPNEDDAQFFVNVFDFLDNDNVMFEELVLGGDLNTTLDFKMDRKSDSLVDAHSKKRNVLLEFMEHNDMLDVWRMLHPQDFQFSYKRMEPKVTMSRIDYFLISHGITNVEKCELIPRYKTDHSMLMLDIQFCDSPRGPGYWKFNSLLLHDKDFVSHINAVIEEFFENVQASGCLHNPAVIWESLKATLIAEAKSFSIKKAKGKHNLMDLFQHKLQKLDEQLIRDPSNSKIKKDIRKTEQFLQDEYESVTMGAMFRSKCEFYELGQKPTK